MSRKHKKNKRKIVFLIIAILIVLLSIFTPNFFNKMVETLDNVTNFREKLLSQNIEIENAIIDNSLKVYFIDVGQADSILLTNQGKYMLIDAGNNADGDKLVNYFNTLGIKKFDLVFTTHAHEDHAGGMDEIINNFKIGRFYMPDVITTTKTYEDIIDSLTNKNIKYNTPREGSTYSFGDASVKVLYVGNQEDNLNANSIILKVTYGEVSFLFTGDTVMEVENSLLDKELESTVLKVAHHGSSSSTSQEFLNKVNPKYAIISCEINNEYGHPHREVMNKLNKIKDLKIYRTDKQGTIIFKTDGKEISVTTAKTNTNGVE